MQGPGKQYQQKTINYGYYYISGIGKEKRLKLRASYKLRNNGFAIRRKIFMFIMT